MENEIKSWLIRIDGYLPGLSEYYGAYSKENPETILLENDWFQEVAEEMWYNYSYLLNLEDDWEGMSKEEKDEYGTFEEFQEDAYNEWMSYTSITVEECPEEEFTRYTPGGCEMEIVYDERNNE